MLTKLRALAKSAKRDKPVVILERSLSIKIFINISAQGTLNIKC